MGVSGTVDERLNGGVTRHEGSSGLMGPQTEGVAKRVLETNRLLLPARVPGMAGVRGSRDLQVSSSVASLWSFTDFALPLLPNENALGQR